MTNFIFNFIRSSAGVLISRFFGLIRDVTIAVVYGATSITDIFFVALALPNLFREFFVEGAMSSAFMPFLSEKYKKGGRVAQNLYLTQIIMVQILLVSTITILIMIFAEQVLHIFLPSEKFMGNKELVALGVELILIVMPFLILICIIGMLSGILNMNRSYFISYSSSALFNICMIIGAWIAYSSTKDIKYLAYGVIAGGVLQLIVVYITAVFYGYRPNISFKFDPDVKKTYLLLIPSLVGVSISQLNFIIGRILTSFLPGASISWLFYANRLFQFPLGIFSVTLGVVSLTELSRARADNDLERRNEVINKAFLTLIVIIIPSTIGLICLSSELVKFIFVDLSYIILHKSSAFSEESVLSTALALQMYSAGLIFFSLNNLLTRVYHSEKDTLTPVKSAFAAFIVNIVMCLILMFPLKHAGIALAASIAAFVNSSILYSKIRDFKFNFRKSSTFLCKIIFANIILLITIFICKYFNIHVILNIILCIIVYFLFLKILKINIFRLLR